MSFARFQGLPRRVGWQYWYGDGKAHIAPAKLHVELVLDLQTREFECREGMRPVIPADAKCLEIPFLEAFAWAPEYADYSAARFARTGREYCQRFFGTVRGEWSPCSIIAEHQSEIIGAALIKRRPQDHLLDCLFVAPRFARQGWATAMVGHVIRQLLELGETQLHSYVHLANEPSLAWHRLFGFRELPNLRIAAHRWRAYEDELARCRALGNTTELEIAKLEELAACWKATVAQLSRTVQPTDLEGELA
ncbi:MAG: GNAT family N-acetyltransferase [Planctomycetia bacterium]|nr:GNAT family N-acetyltransferase [Planctomycetia bacterium]